MNDIKDYKNIWIFSEIREGEIQEVTLELIGKARGLVDTRNERVVALLVGQGIMELAKDLIHYGADEVVVVENELLERYRTDLYTDVLTSITEKYKPSILLFGATSTGRDLAPRLANRIKTGLSADCIDLGIDDEGLLIQTKPSFGGNIMVEILCPDFRPQMATVRPKVFKTPEKDLSRRGNIIQEEIRLNPEKYHTRIIDIIKESQQKNSIEGADIVIVGGRGMQSKEKFDKLYELAEILGGVVCGTRPAVREGWIDESKQIGQSGKTIAPRLLINFGVSGAVQYIVGVKNAKTSIAINKDENASIFKACDYGIVGDATKLVDIFVKELKEKMMLYGRQ